MNDKKLVRIGGGSGFWGDSEEGPKQLIKQGNIDYLVFDYLAEITMSIMTRAKAKRDDLGYALDFVSKVLKPLINDISKQGIKVVSNAGGVNPQACADAIQKVVDAAGVELKIAVVLGDDLMDRLDEFKQQGIGDFETGAALPDQTIMSMNAYLGADPIVKALDQGADIVITGRCADSACTLGILMHEFGWSMSDYDLLSAGSLAGHLVECTTQVTGGACTDWETQLEMDSTGFPILECYADGSFVVTKTDNSGGGVNIGTVGEQMVYEIGDPRCYLLPDVVTDWTQVTMRMDGDNRVLVDGAKGLPPTDSYKVSLTYMDGYRSIATFTVGGGRAGLKAKRVGEALLKRTSRMFAEKGYQPYSETSIDVIGAGTIYGEDAFNPDAHDVMLKLGVKHTEKEAVSLFSREIAPAALSTVPGMTGFFGGRPSVSPVIRLFSCLVSKQQVPVSIAINGEATSIDVAPGAAFDAASLGAQASGESIDLSGPTRSIPLIDLAWARSGDKGNHSNIGIIARKAEYVPILRSCLTTAVVGQRFAHYLEGRIERYELPGTNAFNFMLYDVLGGGGIASLRIDPQGKCYAQMLLEITLDVPAAVADQLGL